MANFSLFARLGLNTKAFQNGIDQASNKTRGFSGILKGLGGQLAALASVGGLILASRRAIQLGRDMEQLANRTNTTVEAFMSLRAAAIDSGSSQQTLERALRNVNARTVEATRGNKAYGDALEELGLNVEKFAALSVEQRFEAIARSVANADDEMKALAIASRILGERAGPELLETLREVGSKGLDPLIDKMTKAGRVMDRDTVKALEALDTNMGALKERFTILVAVLIARVTPAILKLTEWFVRNGKTIGIVIGALGSYLIVLKTVAMATRAYAAAVKALVILKGALAVAIGVATKGLVFFRIALVKTGIGALIVAAGLAVAWLTRMGRTAKEAAGGVDELQDKSKKAADEVSKAFEDMDKAAQKAGRGSADMLSGIRQHAFETSVAIGKLYKDWLESEREFERKRKQEQEEAFLRTQELEALKARSRGDTELADRLDAAVEKTREALRLQERYNIELQEAADIIKGMDTQSDAASVRAASRTPEGLAAAASVAGRGAGASFTPMDDGNFQRFVGGQEAGVFSDEELRQALRDRLADDGSEKLLGDIVEALRGRFVNE